MSQSLTWSFDVAVANGPHFSASQLVSFEAYDKIAVVVPAATVTGGANAEGGANAAEGAGAEGAEGGANAEGAGGESTVTAATATVEVQPGGQHRVQFLLITSSVYSPDLSLQVDGRDFTLTLDAPLVLAGAGAVALLGETQNKFEFTNKINPPTPATVSILAGRKATA